MFQYRTLILAGLTAVLLAVGGAASASAIIASSPTAFNAALGAGQTQAVDFGNTALQTGSGSGSQNGNSFSWTGGSDGRSGVYAASAGLVSGIAAPPAALTSGHFFAATGGGALDLTLAKAATSMSVYIGSLDSFNTITFDEQDGSSQSFTGTELAALVPTSADGDQSSGQTNRRFYFNFGGKAVDKVVFASNGNSFEFTDIAFGFPGVSGVPEPQAWMMLILGVGMTGFAVRRRSAGAPLAA